MAYRTSSSPRKTNTEHNPLPTIAKTLSGFIIIINITLIIIIIIIIILGGVVVVVGVVVIVAAAAAAAKGGVMIPLVLAVGVRKGHDSDSGEEIGTLFD